LAFLPSIGIFVNCSNKTTLAYNYKEAKEVEKYFIYLGIHPTSKETKVVEKNPLLLTKPPEK